MVEQFNNSSHISHPTNIISDAQSSISTSNKLLTQKTNGYLGSIYTPPDIARFLTSWAIRSQQDKILDIGIGEGAFIFASYQRLVNLGASDNAARQQLHGAEIDTATYKKFISVTNGEFPNLHNEDFFAVDFPTIDAVVGNPPYVRRAYLENIEKIRQYVTTKNLSIQDSSMNRMTDLYIYFLLHALSNLKTGGKLAVITADPWLNVSYGEVFKRYLHNHFEIENLISLDRRVFKDADVKPVLLLATKKEKINSNWPICFIRIKNGLPINRLQQIIDQPETRPGDVVFSTIKTCELKATSPWGIHFKAPELYEELSSNKLMAPIGSIAQTRIGIQTLAKEFFVLTPQQVEALQIEPDFLEPLAQSLTYFNQPVIELGSNPNFYLFYCSNNKGDLQGTKALEYIITGENTRVQVRGKDTFVNGFHEKERIQRSSRPNWYDLRTLLETRGRFPILIPRLIYRNFVVLWNKAGFVPGELFIEFLPHAQYGDEVYLAILNSSISEILIRIHAQVYGGGTYNINPGKIKEVPVINAKLLSYQQRKALKVAYFKYLSDPKHDRAVLDEVLNKILGLNASAQKQVKEVLEDLLMIAISSKKAAPNHI